MKKLITLTLSLFIAFSLCLTVSAGTDNVIAKDGDGNEYTSLEQILRESTGSPIKLSNNYTVSNDYLYTNVSNIDLDLNGFELNIGGGYISCKHNLTIRDTSDSQTGKIIFSDLSGSSSSAHIAVSSGAKFTLESGQIVNESNNDYASTTIKVSGPSSNDGTNGQVIINGGTIDNSQSTDACIKTYRTGAIVTINGGTLKSKGNILVEDTSQGDTKIEVNNGTFSSDVSAYLANDSIIVKHNDDYKVYSANDTVEVNEDTKALAGLSSAARKVLNEAGSTADGKTSSIKGYSDINQDLIIDVNSSTQIWLETSLIASETEDVKKATDKAKEVITSNLKYISLDIALKSTYSSEQFSGIATITDLGNDAEGNEIKMPVTLYLSDALKDKDVKVIRVHNGVATILDTEDVKLSESGKVLTFKTSKFSTYVIAYGTSSSSGGNTDPVPSTDTTTTTTTSTKSYDAKDKNKDGVVSCEEEMNSANWVWSTSKQACVYKVTNTSSK